MISDRRITRWEREHALEAVQRRLDKTPEAARVRRQTAGHLFGTLKARMGATHFLMKRLPEAAAEMALQVLQFHAGDEYHWRQALDCGDHCIYIDQ